MLLLNKCSEDSSNKEDKDGGSAVKLFPPRLIVIICGEQ